MNRVTLVSLVLLIGAAAPRAHQAKPDFSGNWTVAHVPGVTAGEGRGAADHPGGMGGGAAKPICGSEFSLTQDAAALRITRPLGDKTVNLVLKLDGSAVRHAAPLCRVQSPMIEKEAAAMYEAAARQGISLDMVTTATWSGDSLVLTSGVSTGRERIERKQSLSLIDAMTLVIETTGSVNGVKSMLDRTAYRRKK